MTDLNSPAGAALAAYRNSQAPPRIVRDRVNLSDSETIVATELATGDTFVCEGRIWIALSGRSDNGIVFARPWEDRSELTELRLAEDAAVLVFC